MEEPGQNLIQYYQQYPQEVEAFFHAMSDVGLVAKQIENYEQGGKRDMKYLSFLAENLNRAKKRFLEAYSDLSPTITPDIWNLQIIRNGEYTGLFLINQYKQLFEQNVLTGQNWPETANWYLDELSHLV